MRFEIGFHLPGDFTDSVIIEGDTIEEIREKADAEVEKRGGIDPWSREL